MQHWLYAAISRLKFNPQPQSLNDGKQYHIDLERQNSTVLVEQMRVIDIARIDKPMRKNGEIVSLTEKDCKAFRRLPLSSFLVILPLDILAKSVYTIIIQDVRTSIFRYDM